MSETRRSGNQHQGEILKQHFLHYEGTFEKNKQDQSSIVKYLIIIAMLYVSNIFIDRNKQYISI